MATGELLLHTAGLNVRLRASARTQPLLEQLTWLWSDSEQAFSGEPDIDVCLLTREDAAERVEPAQPAHSSSPDLLTITVNNPAAPQASYTVSGKLTQRLIETLIGARLLLHAAAIDVHGIGTVLVTGPSGAGKTTATLHLGQHGTYLTDELSILNPSTFAITPYPKPLSLIQEQTESGRVKADVRPDEVGIREVASAEAPAPALFLLADRSAEAERATLEPVALLDALAIVAGQSSSIWRIEDPLGTTARLLDSVGGLHRATYPEASGLLEAIRTTPPLTHTAGQWETIFGHENPAALITDAAARLQEPHSAKILDAVPSDAQLRLWPFHQALWNEEGVAVLTKHPLPHLVVARGAGAIAWDCLLTAAPMSFGELVEAVQERIGQNPGASALLSEIVRNLAAQHVIAIS